MKFYSLGHRESARVTQYVTGVRAVACGKSNLQRLGKTQTLFAKWRHWPVKLEARAVCRASASGMSPNQVKGDISFGGDERLTIEFV